MSSEALNPEPVTELPLTPPAEEDDEDAAIASENFQNTKSQILSLPTFVMDSYIFAVGL